VALSTTTWAGGSGIRDALITAIEGVTPALDASCRFRRPDDRRSDLRTWAAGNPSDACLRRFELRMVDKGPLPEIQYPDARQVEARCELLVAYHTAEGFYGPLERDDMERWIESDSMQLRDELISTSNLIAGWNGVTDVQESVDWGDPTFLSLQFTVLYYNTQSTT